MKPQPEHEIDLSFFNPSKTIDICAKYFKRQTQMSKERFNGIRFMNNYCKFMMSEYYVSSINSQRVSVFNLYGVNIATGEFRKIGVFTSTFMAKELIELMIEFYIFTRNNKTKELPINK